MCSMHGLPTIGTIGFGWFDVSGRRRVPSPPAMTTALTRSLSHGPPRRNRVEDARREREREPGPRKPSVDDEENDRGVDHQAVCERIHVLAELRLDVPAAREPAVELVAR